MFVGWRVVVEGSDAVWFVFVVAAWKGGGEGFAAVLDVCNGLRESRSELCFKFFGADAQVSTVKLDLVGDLPLVVRRTVGGIDFAQ